MKPLSIIITSVCLVTAFLPSAVADIYTWTGSDGAVSFTDDPGHIPASERQNARKTEDTAAEMLTQETASFQENRLEQTAPKQSRGQVVKDVTDDSEFSEEDRSLLPILNRVMRTYCTFNLESLKAVTLSEYWKGLKKSIDKEGYLASAKFFREFCFDTYAVVSTDRFPARSRTTNRLHPVINLSLNGNRSTRYVSEESTIGCTASFVKVDGVWKYIDIICGASWGYPPGFQKP